MSAIGVFDSGVGGLTVARAIQTLLPNESIVYMGDTARVPYGGKSRKSIVEFSIENVEFLLSKGVKFVVVACNTASAVALDTLRERFDVPILGVIEAGAAIALSVSKSSAPVGVIGTYRTIKSAAYTDAITALDPSRTVVGAACPLFVPLVEEDFRNKDAIRLIIKEYLDGVVNGIDTLILGCTHYPLLKDDIRAVYPSLTLVDSSEAVADALRRELSTRGLLAGNGVPSYEYYVSDLSENFLAIARRIVNDETVVIKEIVL